MTIAVIINGASQIHVSSPVRIDQRRRLQQKYTLYAIPVAVIALDSDLDPLELHYRTQYGFVYAGAAFAGVYDRHHGVHISSEVRTFRRSRGPANIRADMACTDAWFAFVTPNVFWSN
jgi:hypothetical protein